jgi:ribosomal protein S18 acetylase RimI-like enzyme
VRIALHRAGVPDLPTLAGLWKTMVEHHRRLVGGDWPVRPADDAWVRRREQYSAWLAEGSGFIFIARVGDTESPVGYAACRLLPAGPTFDLGEVRGDVDSLVTAEAVRGQGVGTALLGACRNELQQRGARYWSIGVVEANSQAVELYTRLGFRPFVRSMLAPIDEPSRTGQAPDQ